MADTQETIRRRLRRLGEMDKAKAVDMANRALKDTWSAGRKPDNVVLRLEFIQRTEGDAPLVNLIKPQGIALRFYLLALFEAQCRLPLDATWTNSRPLRGPGSWSDFIATDGAYDTRTQKYMRDTKQGRTRSDLRLRQIQGALRTLEELGPERALVAVPQAENGGRRQYAGFTLMKETGRGSYQTPDTYVVPRNVWSVKTVTVPATFFLNGWVQVLHSTEIATWLILRALSQWARKSHAESGVYLYGKAREEDFGMRRNPWEDACQRLLDFDLIRHAHAGDLNNDPTGFGNMIVNYMARWERDRYEPYRWQITDMGLNEDAMKIGLRELTLRQKNADRAAEARERKKSELPSK